MGGKEIQEYIHIHVYLYIGWRYLRGHAGTVFNVRPTLSIEAGEFLLFFCLERIGKK